MRLIQDFTQFETPLLLRGLKSFKRTIIGLPICFAIIPTLGIVALNPTGLWWSLPVYLGGILLVTGLIGVAFGRNVAEIEKRLNKAAQADRGN